MHSLYSYYLNKHYCNKLHEVILLDPTDEVIEAKSS